LAVEDEIHFFDGGNSGEFFRELRGSDQLGGILFDDAFARQPAVERAHRGERACDGSFA